MTETVAKAPRDVTQLSDAELIQQIWATKRSGADQLVLGSEHATGNGRKPTSFRPQPGCWIVAPFLPHELQRTRCRSRSLDTSAPQRMTATAQASGAWCWHRSHQSHTHGVVRCSSPKVGIGPGCIVTGCYRLAAIASGFDYIV